MAFNFRVIDLSSFKETGVGLTGNICQDGHQVESYKDFAVSQLTEVENGTDCLKTALKDFQEWQ